MLLKYVCFIPVMVNLSFGSLTKQEVMDAFHEYHKSIWKLYAKNCVAESKKNSFIHNSKYYDSYMNVISKAIADCASEQNEFEGISDRDKIIIRFRHLEPCKFENGYTVSNWIAVFLYNYVALCYNETFKANCIQYAKDKFKIGLCNYGEIFLSGLREYIVQTYASKKYLKDKKTITKLNKLDKLDNSEIGRINKSYSDFLEYNKVFKFAEFLSTQIFNKNDIDELSQKNVAWFDKNKYLTLIKEDIIYTSFAPCIKYLLANKCHIMEYSNCLVTICNFCYKKKKWHMKIPDRIDAEDDDLGLKAVLQDNALNTIKECGFEPTE